MRGIFAEYKLNSLIIYDCRSGNKIGRNFRTYSNGQIIELFHYFGYEVPSYKYTKTRLIEIFMELGLLIIS